MKSETLMSRPIHVEDEGSKEKSGRSRGAWSILSIPYSRGRAFWPNLCEDAAIVWVESAFIEKQSFLYCTSFSHDIPPFFRS